MKKNVYIDNIGKKIFNAKEINKSILRQYAVIIAIWVIVCVSLILLFAFYTYDMEKIYSMQVSVAGLGTKTIDEWRSAMPEHTGLVQQTIYKEMVKAAFGTSETVLAVGNKIPIVWFSCMLFIPNFSSVSNWQTVWDSKLLTVTTCQIYILISTILAIVGLIFYIVLVSQYKIKLSIADKKGFTHNYPLYKNDFTLYTNTQYVNFIIAISVFFSFYALSATIIMLIYMLVIKAIYKWIAKQNEERHYDANIFNTSDLSYFKTLFVVMGVMIAYNIANSIITNKLNVDINSVLSGFFTAGGIAVIIASLVKNLLSSSITQIRKKMTNIDKQIKEIHFFYLVRKGEAAFDFEFAKILPPVIKKIINTHDGLNTDVLKESLDKLFDYTSFIYEFKFSKNQSKNNKRRNFILYRMYNEIDSFAEMEDIKVNLLKEVTNN